MKRNFLRIGAIGLLAVVSGCKLQWSSFAAGWSSADLKATTNVIRTAEIPAGLKILERKLTTRRPLRAPF